MAVTDGEVEQHLHHKTSCMTVSGTDIVIINYIRLTQFIRHSGVTVGYDCTGQPDMDRCTVYSRKERLQNN